MTHTMKKTTIFRRIGALCAAFGLFIAAASAQQATSIPQFVK